MDVPHNMITFKRGNKAFTYRVAGVVIHNNHILFQKGVRDNFWFLPGGRAELNETAQETIIREMQEELGVEIRVERLLWVVENLFKFENATTHELGLYFLMSFPEDTPIYEQGSIFERDHAGDHLVFEWLPLDQLAESALYPLFLRTVLPRKLPAIIEHIVNDER